MSHDQQYKKMFGESYGAGANYEESRVQLGNGKSKLVNKPWENALPANLETLRKCVFNWTEQTFGRPRDPLTKIESELAEIKDNPGDLEEWADLLILLMDAYSLAQEGKTAADLLEMAWQKMEKNKARKWAAVPGKPGTYQHIKTDAL